MKYAIWERFSPEARRAAATAHYRPYGISPIRNLRALSQGFCACPLGIALNEMGIRSPAGDVWGSPAPAEFSYLRQIAYRGIKADAEQFIVDWDKGEIDPLALPALLEVE